MAFQVGAHCFSSSGAALSAIVAQHSGAVMPRGAELGTISGTVSGDSIVWSWSSFSGGVPVVHQESPALSPCVLLDWSDALVLGWAIAGVWLTVFAVTSIRKAIHL